MPGHALCDAESTYRRVLISSNPAPTPISFLHSKPAIAALLALILLASALVVVATGVDQATVETVSGWRLPYLTEAMVAATQLGSTAAIAVASLVLTWGLWRRGARLPLGPGLTAVGAGLTSMLVKILVERPRPSVVEALVSVKTFSFPSGHALIATAFYGAAAMALATQVRGEYGRIALYCIAGALTLVIGVSRVYLGVHYPSDVLAGYGLGAALLAVYAAVADNRRQPV